VTNAAPPAVISHEDREIEAARNAEALRAFMPTDIPWDRGGRELATTAVRAHGVGAVQHMAQMGRWLAYAKTQLDHGDYGAWLESMNIEETFARRAIGVGVRLAKYDVESLGATKCYALLGLADEQLAELEATGVVGALRREDMENMTAAELREEVRRLTGVVEKGKDQNQRLKDKNAKLSDTVETLTDLAAKRKQEADDAKELAARSMAIKGTLDDLRDYLHEAKLVPTDAVSGTLIDLFRDIDSLRAEFPELFAAIFVAKPGADDAEGGGE